MKVRVKNPTLWVEASDSIPRDLTLYSKPELKRRFTQIYNGYLSVKHRSKANSEHILDLIEAYSDLNHRVTVLEHDGSGTKPAR